VKFLGQLVQLLRSPEVRFNLIEVLLPIAMVCRRALNISRDLQRDRRDPDGIEAHAYEALAGSNSQVKMLP
jgi:hypothetical protein